MARGDSEAGSRWISIQDIFDAMTEREEVEWIKLSGSFRELGLDLHELTTGRAFSGGRPPGPSKKGGTMNG